MRNWTNRSEIKRLWPHRQGESYIRHLIRVNIRDARSAERYPDPPERN